MDRLPENLRREGCTPAFDQDSLPESLQQRHALPAGRWGLLEVSEGEVDFEDLASETKHRLTAPAKRVIAPESPHRLHLSGAVRLHVEFYVPDSSSQS